MIDLLQINDLHPVVSCYTAMPGENVNLVATQVKAALEEIMEMQTTQHKQESLDERLARLEKKQDVMTEMIAEILGMLRKM